MIFWLWKEFSCFESSSYRPFFQDYHQSHQTQDLQHHFRMSFYLFSSGLSSHFKDENSQSEFRHVYLLKIYKDLGLKRMDLMEKSTAKWIYRGTKPIQEVFRMIQLSRSLKKIADWGQIWTVKICVKSKWMNLVVKNSTKLIPISIKPSLQVLWTIQLIERMNLPTISE